MQHPAIGHDGAKLAVTFREIRRLLEIHPADDDTRFSLAYKYSELNRDGLAAYHYSRILPENRGPMAWNNLGVSLAKLGLPIKAVEAYREAERHEETLAMSNLAHKLSEAGFVPEARLILDAAMAIKDHHQNVEKARGIINDAVDAEQKKEIEAFDKAKPICEYYRQFGRALGRPEMVSIEGKWRAPKCILELVEKDKSVVARGTYEIPMTMGAGLLNAAFGVNPPTNTTSVSSKYELEYAGAIRGGTITGSIVDRQVGSVARADTALLTSADRGSPFLMWIADTGDQLHVCEYDGHSEPKFYKLTRD